jgi:hypothetical protein
MKPYCLTLACPYTWLPPAAATISRRPLAELCQANA